MRTEERAPRTPFVLDIGHLRGGPQKSRAESPVHPHTRCFPFLKLAFNFFQPTEKCDARPN